MDSCSAEALASLSDTASDPEVGEFFAILSDMVSHRMFDGECFCPDSWQTLRELVASSDAVAAVLEDAPDSLSYLFDAVVAYGQAQGWAEWSA